MQFSRQLVHVVLALSMPLFFVSCATSERSASSSVATVVCKAGSGKEYSPGASCVHKCDTPMICKTQTCQKDGSWKEEFGNNCFQNGSPKCPAFC